MASITCAPLFRCLPSEPHAKIVLARKRTPDIFPSCRTFDRFILDLDGECATWDDCSFMVKMYNRVIHDFLQGKSHVA